jgi:amino acid adenylation domain-containing protein
LLQVHHICIDHVTFDALLAEVRANMNGNLAQLPEPVPYRNHVAQALAYARSGAAEAFFRDKLADVTEPAAPFGLQGVRGDIARIVDAYAEVEAEMAERVRIAARKLGVTAATVFHAAWGQVLAHVSGKDDVVFGTVLMGRLKGSVGARRALGMFINTLPLRLRLADLTVRELIERTQRELVDLLDHEQASLAVAQRCSGIAGAVPLFTTLLNYRHSTARPPEHDGEEALRVLAAQERTNYPIAVSIDDSAAGFFLKVQADPRIDARRVTTYLRTAIQSLVEALESSPEQMALALPILPVTERLQVLESFNATRTVYPSDKLLHELFEDQVARMPDATAVIEDGREITYAELNATANRLARYLQKCGVRPGEYVPVVLPRSLQLLVVQLALLKSGAVYVPVDPQLPVARREFMVRDCKAVRVIGDEDLFAESALDGVMHLDPVTLDQDISYEAADDLLLSIDPAPPAYVMYTSGSTGVPKGVVVTHRAVNRLVVNNGYCKIELDDCIAHHSNPAFDASTFEIWAALLNGARVLIVPRAAALHAGCFSKLLAKHRVSILWMSVGLFNQSAEALADVLPRLRCLIIGGDILDPQVIRRVLQRSPPQRLLNAYGPTECTTFTTTYTIDAVERDATSIPIGRPIANTQVYILNRAAEPAPIGVTGEIYVGGAGVAQGYLNRPDLTAERFVADPFNADATARLYRTGDFGRWREDGAVEFLGRIDQQVKIRGFRIELGEIEARLSSHEHVREAVVVAREDTPGEKQLVAYVVPASSGQVGAVPSVETLRGYLGTQLPDYMMPSAFVLLDAMPLTPNGKIDRRALPAPDRAAHASREYEPPQGAIEEVLAAIWRQVLQVERVGRHDDFFELGGQSLLGMKLAARVAEQFDLGMSVAAVFKYPTVREMATIVQAVQYAGTSAAAAPLDSSDDTFEFEEGILDTNGVVAPPGSGQRGSSDGLGQR